MRNVAQARRKGKGQEIKVSFSGRSLTSNRGIALLSRFLRKLRLEEVLEKGGQIS